MNNTIPPEISGFFITEAEKQYPKTYLDWGVRRDDPLYDTKRTAFRAGATSLYQHLQENGRVAELEKELETVVMQRDYLLKDQEVKHKEVERLKGLIKKLYESYFKSMFLMTNHSVDEAIEQGEKSWGSYKTENNL